MVSSIGYSLGIGSGLDIKTLVEGLAAAERAPKEALLKRREESNTAKVSALAEAAQAIDSFSSAVSTLVSGGSLFSQPSVSAPDLMSATAIPGARLTSLSAQMEILQLAKAQTLESVKLASADEPVGEGELTLTTAAGSFSVLVDSTNNSLTKLAESINSKSAGVTASIVHDAYGARLVLKGGSGAANAFTLSVPSGTASGLERFAYGPGVTGGMTQAQAAQDAIVKLDGVEVSRSSNSFKDLIPGIQIDLKEAAPGKSISLGITRPTASIEQAMVDFVDAYNQVASLLSTATAPGQNGVGQGPLRGDISIRDVRRQLAALPSAILSSRSSIKTLSEIGVSTNRDGTLSLNKARLSSMLQSDPNGVEALFNPEQYSSDPALVVSNPMGKVKPGTYTLTDLVPASATGPATGMIEGQPAISSGSFIVASSTSPALGLVVGVNGAVASATVTVDSGLAGALQSIRDSLRARSGPLDRSQERLTAEARDIARDRTALEARSKAYYERLVTSFTATERKVSAFKATQSYLQQQIRAWSSGND